MERQPKRAVQHHRGQPATDRRSVKDKDLRAHGCDGQIAAVQPRHRGSPGPRSVDEDARSKTVTSGMDRYDPSSRDLNRVHFRDHHLGTGPLSCPTIARDQGSRVDIAVGRAIRRPNDAAHIAAGQEVGDFGGTDHTSRNAVTVLGCDCLPQHEFEGRVVVDQQVSGLTERDVLPVLDTEPFNSADGGRCKLDVQRLEELLPHPSRVEPA